MLQRYCRVQPCTNTTRAHVENQKFSAPRAFASTRVMRVSAWHACQHVVVELQQLNKVAARREFYTLEMLSNEKVLPYINRVKHLASKLKSMNVPINDK